MPTALARRRLELSGGTVATAGLLAVTAAWGSTFVLIKDLVAEVPVADFLAVRFWVAAVALWLLRPGCVRALPPPVRRQAVLLGFVYGAAQVLQTAGLQTTDASVSGFLTAMYVVFTPLVSAAVLRDSVPRAACLGVALATAGVAVLSLRGLAIGGGELLTLLSALLYGVHIVALGRWSPGRDAIGLATVQLVVVAVICSVGAAPGGLALPPDAGAWAGTVYTALVAGAFAMVVQTWAQARLAATRAAVVMTLEPVFAGAFAVLLGGDSVTSRLVLGGALVLVAIYVVELGPRRGREATVPHASAP